jgi:DNA-binding NarL/FixJ family response regulator
MVKRTSFKSAHCASAVPARHATDTQSEFQQDNNAAARDSSKDAIGGSIIIIEKRALIRDCLTRCLRMACEHDVIAVRDVEEWIELSPTTPASLVILSLVGGAKTAEASRDISRLVQAATRHPTIVLSDGDDLDQIVNILDNGARGYIPTDLTLDIAIEAMRLVKAGGVYVPASSLVAARRSGEPAPAAAARGTNGIFTARQAAVVDALRRGKANKVIAYELKMRESTVKVHVRNIMKKLNAKNRTEVAFMANELIKGSEATSGYAGR